MTLPEETVALHVVSGRYRLREVLGRGGMGTVWRAEDLLLRRPVAIKEVLLPAGLDDAEREVLDQRTLREARAAARIRSRHAVQVYDVVQDGDRPWIVMELTDGVTLAERVRDGGPLPSAEVAAIGLQLLNALTAAHAADILHRDVKPSNVLLGADGRVVLTDFGIARALEDTTLTRSGLLLGSAAYTPPERALGRPAEPASDLWSLGATLFTAVEGHPPYDGRDPVATLAAIVDEPPPLAYSAGPLAPVLARLMDRDPARRPQPAELRRQLAAVAAAPEPTRALPPRTAPAPPPPPAPPDRSAPTPSWPARRERSTRRRGLALVVVLLLIGAAVLAATLHHPAGGTTSTRSAAPTHRAAGSAPSTAPASRGSGTSSHRSSAAASAPASTGSSSAGAGGSSSTSATGSSSGSSSTSASGSSSQGGFPSRYVDPAVGWSIGRPAGWTVRLRDGHTDLIDPSGGRYLRVDTTGTPGPSARGAWADLESGIARRHPGYTRLRLETISWRGYPDVADWEFTYRSGGTTLHALDRGVVVGADRAYGLYFQTRDADWASSASLRKALYASFQPAP